jgi:hypothetical protein
MGDIIDKPMTADRLPPELRGDLAPNTLVLVSVRTLTANGLTTAQEDAILSAEADTAAQPFRPAREVLADLRRIADAD